MTISAGQLSDSLRRFVRGPVAVDPVTRSLYATDASPFYLLPDAIFTPLDEADLAAAVRFCHEHNLPMVARGAGTGLAGESLSTGLMFDLSVHFRNILAHTPTTITVEPGLTLAELNEHLCESGRWFPPDPASAQSCTLGGMVATNASGGRAFRYGTTRDYVEAVRVVWDDGSTETICRDTCATPTGRTAEIVAGVTELARTLPATSIVARTPFDRAGFAFDKLNPPPNLSLLPLLIGSEGTLGFLTALTLRTVPRAGGRCPLIAGFATLDAALKAGPDLRRVVGISACDLLDQRLVALARATRSDPDALPSFIGAALVIELEADTQREALARGHATAQMLRTRHGAGIMIEPTIQPEGIERVRAFRGAVVSGLYSLGRGRRPEAFVEDCAVPVDVLPAFLSGVQDILRTQNQTASFLVHLLTGQVHTRPMVDLNSDADRQAMWTLADQIFTLAQSMGGTISTQHGIGIARTPWLEKQSLEAMAVYREIKRIFDPRSLLNPGKIVGPDPSRPAWPMRPLPATTEVPRVPLYIWPDSPAAEASKCNGCGDCRPRTGTARMCPIFRATGAEAATPRAKANLLKLFDTPEGFADDAVREVAGLCVNCKMCRDECRANVDIPKLMLEAKAAHYAAHGLDRRDWVLARSESLAAFAGTFAFSANLLLGTRWSRWLAEQLTGISRRRLLPRFTHRTFLRRAWSLGLTTRKAGPPGRKLAYFVDTFANSNDPKLALATVAVLNLHGYDVHVPWKQRSSGMTLLSFGDIEAARERARYNVRTFAPLVREGYTIVCSEPTAALALTQEYPNLLDDEDTKLVAAHTVELTTLLGELAQNGELKPITRTLNVGIGHHVPCHLKALKTGVSGPDLLRKIPGATVETIDESCSGMAGVWGLAKRHHADSLAAGRPMLSRLERPKFLLGATECSACRMQMQDATGKRTLHPVQYLALAYGLMPELEDRLKQPLRKLLSE